MLRSSGTFCLTWADGLRPRCLALWWQSFCFRYSVRALGLWQYGWYVMAKAWEISQAYKVFRGSAGSAQLKLDWHKNSDLGSEVGKSTGLNSTTLLLRLRGMFCSTWAFGLRPRHLALCRRSLCFRYSVRVLGLWQYGWYVVTKAWEISQCYDKDLHNWFYLFLCTDTGVIATHALSFYRPLAPLSCWLMHSSLLWLRAAPYCTLLRTVTYCCSDAIVLVMLIVRVTLLFSYST